MSGKWFNVDVWYTCSACNKRSLETFVAQVEKEDPAHFNAVARRIQTQPLRNCKHCSAPPPPEGQVKVGFKELTPEELKKIKFAALVV
jgi:hypothetical protein